LGHLGCSPLYWCGVVVFLGFVWLLFVINNLLEVCFGLRILMEMVTSSS
jgi:hypothetical protein